MIPVALPPLPGQPSSVPLHPEATEDPRTIRWVVPAGLLDFVGVPRIVPAPLADLLADGTLVSVRGEPAAVLATSDQPWRSVGPRVRTALAAALEDPEGWVGPGNGVGTGDGGSVVGGSVVGDLGGAEAVLEAAVRQVMTGEVGAYVRSHGGEARLVSIEGAVATIALSGACSACPARGMTLEARFARAVEALCPGAQVRLEERAVPFPRRGLRTARHPDRGGRSTQVREAPTGIDGSSGE